MYRSLVLPVATLCLIAPQTALAQNEESGDEVMRNADIVVTATRQETRLNETPISITVISEEGIARRNLVSFSDYLSTVPGVSFFSLGAGNNSIIIRGLAARPQFDANASGPITGVYFGEVPMSGLDFNGQQPDIMLVDMARVEVLRGPQGTLFGSSNLSGTVRNIPNEPDLSRFNAQSLVGVSETARFGGTNYEAQAMVNLPIIDDRLAVRGVIYHFDRSGFYRNIGEAAPLVAQAVNNFGAAARASGDEAAETYTGGRVSLRWKPLDPIDVTLTYLRQRIEQDGAPGADLSLNADGYTDGRLLTRRVTDLNAVGVLPGDPRVSAPDFRDLRVSDVEVINGVVKVELAFGEVVSSTSYANVRTRIRSTIPLTAADLDQSDPFAEGPQTNANGTDASAFFQEVRFVSKFDGPFQILSGVFFEDVSRGRSPWNGFAGTILASNPLGTPAEPIATFVNELKLGFRQLAVFGEASWQISDQLKLTGGGRFFDYEFDTDFRLFADPFFSPLPDPVVESGGKNGTIFKVGIDYSPTKNVLVYANWSEGFRLGQVTGGSTSPRCDIDRDGFFDAVPGLTTGVRTLRPDTVDNYEIGSKLTLFGGAVQVNAAAFQLDWTDIPLTTRFPNFCSALVNASQARSRGIELESTLSLANGLTVGLGGAYIKAELAADAPFVGSEGDRLPGSPEYNLTASASYDFSIGNRPAYVSADYSYVGAFYNSADRTGIKLGDYGLANIQGGVSLGRTEIQLFAQNLTNANDFTWENVNGSTVFQLRPRTVGMRLGLSF